MKKNISLEDFEQEFKNYGRKDNLSPEGLEALYKYLLEFEKTSGQEQELDVISLCCDFSEYDSIEQFLNDGGFEEEPDIEAVKAEIIVANLPSGGIIIDNNY